MKLLFDMTYLQGANFYSGFYEYSKRIFDELTKNKVNFTVLLIKDYKIDEWILNKNPKIICIEAKKNSRKYFKSIEKVSKDFDYVFLPYQLVQHKFKIKSKLIFTIHDLAQLDLAKVSKINKEERLYIADFKHCIRYIIKIFLRFFGIYYRYYYNNLKYNIKNAYKILAVSNATLDDIINRFKADKSKFLVLKSPFKVSFDSNSDLNYKDYYLFVSASRYTKNTHRGLKALDLLWENDNSIPSAVVAGNPPKKIFKDIKHMDKIICLNYIPGDDLNYLYANAKALIFPSLCEGFGMPPLEAMKFGTNVICSNLPCLKEIYQKVTFFNPYDVDDIKKAIINQKVFSKEELIQEYKRINNECNNDLLKLVDYLSNLK